MLKRLVLVAVLAVVAACKDDPPPVPASIEIVTAAPATATVATAVTAMPSFEVRTASGKAIRGVEVEVTTGTQSGVLTGAPAKTGAGPTPIGLWTLGNLVGSQTVRIALVGSTVAPVTLTVQATAAAPANVLLIAGNNQLAAASSAVANPIRVQVTDTYGNIVANTVVTWTVSAGGGNVASPTSLTNASGIATAPAWTLGTAGSGVQTLVASAGTATRDVNAELQSAGISLETAPAATVLLGDTTSATILIRDELGNIASGVPFTVDVLSGGGVLTGTPAVTDDGVPTSIGTWRIGSAAGTQTLRVTTDGAPPLTISTTGVTNYDLEIVYLGQAALYAEAFSAAVTRIKQAVVGQLSSVTLAADLSLGTGAGACADGQVIPAGTVLTGLRIYATVVEIDGVGQVLGSAGPCYTRVSNGLSLVGRMRFDVADIENMATNGTLPDVILHEMLHVVGIGSLWSAKGLLSGSTFTGPLATAACRDDHGGTAQCTTSVPVEDCVGIAGCGAGTINSHWRELVFRTELMTGYVSAAGTANPFSKMTIQSLADMGYVVNPFAADPYTVPPPALMAAPSASAVRLPAPTRPIAALDAQGRVVHVYPQD